MHPHYDICVIGSGMGGATLAAAIAPGGRSVVVLERGGRLTDSPEARDERAIFIEGRFRPDEQWLDETGRTFNPGNYYCVGGNSKFYGAVLIRYREDDFRPVHHLGGKTSGWPIKYQVLEPWYQKAEDMYRVRGALGEDPTEPPHASPYAFEPVPDEPSIAELRQRLAIAGVSPAPLPLAVDVRRWLDRASTGWDAFPDTCGGKMDAETVGIAGALQHRNVTLMTHSRVERLNVGEGGRIASVDYVSDGAMKSLSAGTFVLAAGAVNSATLLLASASERYPHGLANRSDQVGRNFMNHNCSAVIALHPGRKNTSVYQKTLQFNNFYRTGGPNGEPLGSVQLLGKVTAGILRSQTGFPRWLADWIAARSVDFYAMSEDLPNKESRVFLKEGRVTLHWQRSNETAHRLLVKKLRSTLRRAGYPIILSRLFDRRTPSHQCGTLRMGDDPKTSVVDTDCRSHDHDNLFVADASVLPTSAAVNPALTVAALSLRIADTLSRQVSAS